MPWNETCAMDERVRMIAELLGGEEPRRAVFARYGVSAKTGSKWLGRYQARGAAGLAERAHAPQRHGLALPESTIERVLALRERWPHWGPRKLRVKLAELHPDAGAAGGLDDRRSVAARGPGGAGAAAPALPAGHAALPGGHGAQRRVVRGLQGLVPHRRRPPL